MTVYTCHWLETAPQRKNTAPLLVQLTLEPHGYDGQAYWKRQEARTSANQFKMAEDLAFAQDGGPQALLQRFVELRRTLADAGLQEVVAPDRVYSPASLRGQRPKTADECRMDLAALHTECGDFDAALALLQQCQGSRGAWYWHTAARRAHANRARANPGTAQADADWAAALAHAAFIIDSAAAQGGDVYRMHTGEKGSQGYHFGDGYASAPPQLATAAQTRAEYLLHIAGQPGEALAAIAISDSTSHGTRQIEAYRVSALLQLGRNAPAYQAHRTWQLDLPEVLTDPGYQAFVAREEGEAHAAERERLAALRFEHASGQPASEAELALLHERFPQALEVSAAYRQWLTVPGQPHQLSVVDGEYRQDYTLFSVGEALDKHAELLDWLGLHEHNSSGLAAEIRQAIADDGITPARMLPIVGDADVPDCFLLRTDGPDAGAVYFWSHDQCALFERIVDSADQLFPWLRARAEAGSTFSL